MCSASVSHANEFGFYSNERNEPVREQSFSGSEELSSGTFDESSFDFYDEAPELKAPPGGGPPIGGVPVGDAGLVPLTLGLGYLFYKSRKKILSKPLNR